MNTNTFTVRFFAWLDGKNLKPKDVAEDLNNNTQTVSSWRSKGIPKGKVPACQAIMENFNRAEIESQGNTLNLKLTDDQLDLVETASAIVQTPLRDYIIKATTAAARKDIEKDKRDNQGKTA